MSKLKKIEITIPEAIALTQEFNGTPSQDGKTILVKGLFSQSLSMSSKFDLKLLFNKAAELVKTAEEVKNEFIKENGEDNKEGGKEIKMMIKNKKGEEVPSPKFEEFKTMYNDLMVKKYEIEFKELDPADFDFKAEEVYPMFLEVIERLQK
jgi:hypothetical protein